MGSWILIPHVAQLCVYAFVLCWFYTEKIERLWQADPLPKETYCTDNKNATLEGTKALRMKTSSVME